MPLLPVIGTKWIEPNLNCVELVGLENECDLSARNCLADAYTGSLYVRHRAVVHGAPGIEGSRTQGPILDRELLASVNPFSGITYSLRSAFGPRLRSRLLNI